MTYQLTNIHRLQIWLLYLLLFPRTTMGQNDKEQEQMLNTKWSLGIGALAGPSFVSGLPKGADFLLGNHYGIGISAGYYFTKPFGIHTGLRLMRQQQMYNFNNELDPDQFVMTTTAIQIPMYVSYRFLNKKEEPVLGFTLGAAYEKNQYKTLYKVPNLPRATVSYSRITNNSSADEFALLVGLYKPLYWGNSRNKQLVLFGEYQHGITSSAFLDRINQFPEYAPFADEYRFTHFAIRIGCYFTFLL